MSKFVQLLYDKSHAVPRYNETQLKAVYVNSQLYYNERKRSILNEGQKYISQFDIFLSHSYLDKDVVLGLFIELSRKNYKVYVDWLVDPDLDRNSVSKKTAKRVRRRMAQSDTLFHATSSNAVTSKWMPWETGYMHGLKDKCAIVEITESESSTFVSQEFLLLYPYITEEKDFSGTQVIVNNRDTKRKVSFDSWRSGENI